MAVSRRTSRLAYDWTDFIIGLRVFGELGSNWSMGGRFDGAIGGDSDSAFNLQIVFLRHFGESMHLNLGWRYYDVDFESGTGVDRYKWDVSHSGPDDRVVLGVLDPGYIAFVVEG